MRHLQSRASVGVVALLCGCGSSGHVDRAGPTLPDTTANAGAGGSGGASSPDAGAAVLPRPDKVDLLLMIDNSYSMNVKQPLLSDAVQQLLQRLRTPDCVDASGAHSSERDGTGACLTGKDEFAPVADIHVAAITSSLGDGGENSICRLPESFDMAHVIGSTARGAVAGMNAQGFLEWRSGMDAAAFDRDLAATISAAGDNGCGYEASLEAWYRFLVEPAPYQSLVRVACSPGAASADCMAPATDDTGHALLDQTVLEQRAAFLRPDSLLMIVSVSDENDCSVRVGAESFRMAAPDDRMPRAASACAADPNSACCYSCGSPAPAGCTPDPNCDTSPTVTADEDSLNLRCMEQKRRFGADFLYPTERYVRALTEPRLCASDPSLAPASCPAESFENPLFAGGRPAALISYTSIVGVPWQDITSAEANGPASFESVADLDSNDWDRILGQPHASPPVAPADPFMQESTAARAGIEPGNPINGREYDTTFYGRTGSGPNDLQYACIFRLPAPIDCEPLEPSFDNCDCFLGDNDSPVCEQTPGQSAPGQIQYFGKAYPGLRHLEVLRGLSAQGGNAALGSICASDADVASQSFGYRPAVQALLERVRPILHAR